MRLALRFISGKYQGGEYPLQEDGEVVVGRSSDLDMVLVEEMVSRRHARFLVQAGQLKVEDLGSTNGTFVNGERVSQAVLKEGDRVLIGSNILKVVPADSTATPGSLEPKGGKGGGDARMRGSLQEIPLPDLLQLFGSSRKTGTLVLSTDGQRGKFHLKEGTVRAVEVESLGGDGRQVSGLKVAYRMIAWETGLFELMPEEQRELTDPLEASVQEILMEGFRQKDELAQLAPRLPSPVAAIGPTRPLVAQLFELNKEELTVFQTVLNNGTFASIMDASPHSDLQTAQVLLSLIDRGYVSAGTASPSRAAPNDPATTADRVPQVDRATALHRAAS